MAASPGTELGYRQAAEVALRVLAGDWVVAVLVALATTARRTTDLVATINAVDDQLGRQLHRVPLTVSAAAPTLKRMIAAGLLVRIAEPTPHPRVWYRLTPAGQALLAALAPLAEWARTYHRQRHTGPELGHRQAVEVALRILDGDWVVAVLAALAGGPLRTARLVDAINAVDERIGRRAHGVAASRPGLAPTLKRMTAAGLLARVHDPTTSPAVWYQLTEPGRSLLSALVPLAEWARAYHSAQQGTVRP